MKKKMIFCVLMLSLILVGSIESKPQLRVVTLWTFARNNAEEWKAREHLIEKKFNIDLKVKLISQNSFVLRLNNSFTDKQNRPDIIEWMIEHNKILSRDPDKSLVIPLDKFIKKSKVFKEVVSHRVDWLRYGDRIYGLPHDVHPVILVYNDTIWKSAGVDVSKIETWDQFFLAAKKLVRKKNSNGKPMHYAMPYGNNGLSNSMFMIWQQTGIQLFDKKGNPHFTSKEFKQFIEKWITWYKSGVFTSWDWGNFEELLANGTLCSYTSPDWWISQSTKASGLYSIKIRPLPCYKKGGSISSSWGGSFLAIPIGTKDPETIYKIMEHLQYDSEFVVTRWQQTGMVPPIKKVWKHSSFHMKDSRFGGIQLGEVFIKSANNMPRITVDDFFWDALSDFEKEYFEIFRRNKSIEEALKSVQIKVLKRKNKI